MPFTIKDSPADPGPAGGSAGTASSLLLCSGGNTRIHQYRRVILQITYISPWISSYRSIAKKEAVRFPARQSSHRHEAREWTTIAGEEPLPQPQTGKRSPPSMPSTPGRPQMHRYVVEGCPFSASRTTWQLVLDALEVRLKSLMSSLDLCNPSQDFTLLVSAVTHYT
jgi:hypothetical protein